MSQGSDQVTSLADVITQVQRDDAKLSDTSASQGSTSQPEEEPPRKHKDSLSIQSTRKRSWFHRIFCCMCSSPTETVVHTPPVPEGSFSSVQSQSDAAHGDNQRQSQSHSHSQSQSHGNQSHSQSHGDKRASLALSSSPTEHNQFLLPPIDSAIPFRKTLVLDLDETLVHSSFKPVPSADFVIQIEIDRITYNVYVAKRPFVDEFLRRMGELYEVVVFTASLSKYADPVLDILDIHKVVKYRLFRESCTNHMGNFVKDMSRIGRDARHSMIVDNSPVAYLFQRESAIAITSWFDDPDDRELLDMIPFLESIVEVDDVRPYLENRH